jgi:hypothetical protein
VSSSLTEYNFSQNRPSTNSSNSSYDGCLLCLNIPSVFPHTIQILLESIRAKNIGGSFTLYQLLVIVDDDDGVDDVDGVIVIDVVIVVGIVELYCW